MEIDSYVPDIHSIDNNTRLRYFWETIMLLSHIMMMEKIEGSSRLG